MTLPADLQSIWGRPKQAAVEHNEKPETIFGKEKKKGKKTQKSMKRTLSFHGDFHTYHWNGIKFLHLYSPYTSIT